MESEDRFSGTDLLKGDAGSGTFIFTTFFDRADTASDFTAGAMNDGLLDLRGLGYTALTDVSADTVQNGADAVITSFGGDSITLVGVDKASLRQDDFIFA